MQGFLGKDKVEFQEGPRIVGWNTEATIDATVREHLQPEASHDRMHNLPHRVRRLINVNLMLQHN